MTHRRTRSRAAWVTAQLKVMVATTLSTFLLAGCSARAPVAHAQPARQPVASTAHTETGEPVRVKVVHPTREAVKRLSTPQPAHIGPYEITDIYAKVAGYLETFGEVKGADGTTHPVDIGDRVTKDHVLAKLSVPEMEQERAQRAALVEQARAELVQAEAFQTASEAMVERAQAKLEETKSEIARYEAERRFRKSEYDRYATLVKERAISSELEDEKLNLYQAAMASHTAAKAALATDEANVKVIRAKLAKAQADVTATAARLKVAQANLEYTNVMLSYAIVKAPYAGVITRRLVDTGAFVQSAATAKAEPLFTIAREDRLRILADIPQAEASLVRIGQPATLQVGAGRQPLTGKVVRCADALDSDTRTMRTEVELDAPAKSLRPGMYGSVTITLADEDDALLLPASVVVTGASGPSVMVASNGRAERRAIEIGENDGVRVHVLRGLSDDDQVIAEGKEAIQDGQPIEVVRR